MPESDQTAGSPDDGTELPPTLTPGPPSGAGEPGPAAGSAPPPGPGVPDWWGPGGWAPPGSARRSGFSGFVRSAAAGWAVAGVLALTVVGLAVGLATSNPGPVGISQAGPGRQFLVPGGPSGRGFGFGFGANGGSGGGVLVPFGPAGAPNAPGRLAVVGTVAGLGSGTFSVTSAAGQTVTVTEQNSTTYSVGGKPAAASAVVKGVRVLVFGTRSGNSVTATQVIVVPAAP